MRFPNRNYAALKDMPLLDLHAGDQAPNSPSEKPRHCTYETFTVQDRVYKDFRRTIRMLLPPSYAENAAKPLDEQKEYPLIVKKDGQNSFTINSNHPDRSWQMDRVANDAMNRGEMEEVVIASIDNSWQRFREYTPPWPIRIIKDGEIKEFMGDGDAYADHVEFDILPDILARYPSVSPKREDRVIVASSLAALHSLYTMARRPHMFGAAILLSGSYFWPKENGILDYDNDFNHTDHTFIDWIKNQKHITPENFRIYMGVGKLENLLRRNHEMDEALRSLGFAKGDSYEFEVHEGGTHDESSWSRHLPRALRFLFGKK